jgi:hypothetical protein
MHDSTNGVTEVRMDASGGHARQNGDLKGGRRTARAVGREGGLDNVFLLMDADNSGS